MWLVSFIKKGKFGHRNTHRGKTTWRDIEKRWLPTSQEEKLETDSSLTGLRMNWSCRHLGLGLLAYRAMTQYISVVWGTQSVVLHYGSPSMNGSRSIFLAHRSKGSWEFKTQTLSLLWPEAQATKKISHILWTGFHSKLSTIDAEGFKTPSPTSFPNMHFS